MKQYVSFDNPLSCIHEVEILLKTVIDTKSKKNTSRLWELKYNIGRHQEHLRSLNNVFSFPLVKNAK